MKNKKSIVIGSVVIVILVIIAGCWFQKSGSTLNDIKVTRKQENKYAKAYGEQALQIAEGWCRSCFFMGNALIDDETLKNFQKEYTVEQVKIEASSDGHTIPADYILANNSKDCNTVIIIHGHGCNRRMMPSIEYDFLELGYNVLAYDVATAGENYGKISSYGITDQYELLDCINYVRKEMSADKKLVVCGWSYGGGVLGVALGNSEIDEKIDMAVLDCPIGDFEKFMNFRMMGEIQLTKQEDIDSMQYQMECLNQFTEMMYGFRISEASAEKCVQTTKTPVLIFSSEADDVVPLEIVKDLYNAIPHDKKYLKIFNSAPHTGGSWDDSSKDEYKQILEDFLEGKLY